jgi:hypothetical protein
MQISKSGFFVKGDAKGLAVIQSSNDQDIYLATQNQDKLLVYARNLERGRNSVRLINLKPDDFSADIIYKNNKKRRIEFYYGDTYLSQSSRKLALDNNVLKVVVTNFRGIRRDVVK